MSFVAEERDWIHAHYFSVPQQIGEFCGQLTGKAVLDVGCGDMLQDFGLLPLGVSHVTGLDLADKPTRIVELPAVRNRIIQQGIAVGEDYAERMTYVEYDGAHFPFQNETFDLVISWSAFEHITDVPQVLSEIRRVCRRDGQVFIQVYPWFHCWLGSHLTDYIPEPYFHLKRSLEWVSQQLDDYVSLHPDARHFVFQNMWPEYQTLNKYSANHFYTDVVAAGFKIKRCVVISGDVDLAEAPEGIPLSDLMIFGTKMLLFPINGEQPNLLESHPDPGNRRQTVPDCDRSVRDLSVTLREREAEIADLRNSWSWRITAPLRKVASVLRYRRRL